MTIEIKVLEYLSQSKRSIRSKGLRLNLMGLPDFKYYKYQSLANSFSGLSKKGLVKKMPDGEYVITQKGRSFLENKRDVLKNLETDKKENSPKDLLIIYDIEESRRNERDWLRRNLKKFHFVMIQRSVWVGPSPLPKEFLDYLKEMKLQKNLKIFKLARGYSKKEYYDI